MKLNLNASCRPSRYHKCALLGMVSAALLVSGCGGSDSDEASSTLPHPVPNGPAEAKANVEANPNLSPERKAQILADLKQQGEMAARYKPKPSDPTQPQPAR